MKLRNQLLALACLLGFFALGYWYVQAWVVQKPFGIILFVSDGMVARHLTFARMYKGGAGSDLTIESFPSVALLRNRARDYAVPDAAAAATALATGTRVQHGSVGVDLDGRPLQSILEIARAEGRSVGLVSNGSVTSTAPAAFYAHARDGKDSPAIAEQLVAGSRPDVILGGGAADFVPEKDGGRRKDGRNLVKELEGKGVEVIGSKADLEMLQEYRTTDLVGLFSPGALAFRDEVQPASQQPSLSDMVRRAITFLQQNRRGYVLVVDAALVTTAAEQNLAERTIVETLALDEAVATARRYAGERSLILAVGKHSVGGLSLNGYPLQHDHGMALLGSNAAGQPYLTWATGPSGPAPATPAPLSPGTPATPPQARAEPAAFYTPSALNNAEDVLAVGVGPGSEKLKGWMDNIAIFQLIKESL